MVGINEMEIQLIGQTNTVTESFPRPRSHADGELIKRNQNCCL